MSERTTLPSSLSIRPPDADHLFRIEDDEQPHSAREDHHAVTDGTAARLREHPFRAGEVNEAAHEIAIYAYITPRPRHILVRLTGRSLPCPLWRAYRRDDVADAPAAVARALRHLPLPPGTPVRVVWQGELG